MLTCKDVTPSHMRDQVLHELLHTQFCCTVDKIMNSLHRAAKMMRDIIYHRPHIEHANNLDFFDLLKDVPSLNGSVL